MYEHKSGLPLAFSRADGRGEQQSVVFYGRRPFLQGAELNDVQDIIRGRHDRLGRLIASDGDRVERASAVVDREAGTVTLQDGLIYVEGDVFPVAEKVLTHVPMVGRVEIGVRVTRTWLTADDAPELRGLVPGSEAADEDGAAREVVTLAWAGAGDSGQGEFHQVYLLQDGTILDQTPPPQLSGVAQALAQYDRPHGHYIVSGCRVTALGANAGDELFSIEQGEANINGFKITRFAALRHAEARIWDVGAVPGETHTYTGGASVTIQVAAFPIDTISSILLTKEKTVNVTRGATAHGIDGLPDTSVIDLIEVKQGATVYAKDTSWIRTGNGVDWGPAGPEPGAGQTYTVKYRYRDSVVATSFDDKSITVSGGATGGDIIVSYTYKLPRIDMLCLRQNGEVEYVKGISARANPVRPVPPLDVLPLCQISNNWMGTPTVVNDGVRSIDYGEMWRYFNQLRDHSRLIQLERLKSGINARDPNAKKNMFVDPMIDDSFRDIGVPQNAAVGDGVMQLQITPTFHYAAMVGPVTLDWVEEVIVDQALKTNCVKINPYANFLPLPGSLALTPASDFWTVSRTEWLSEETLEFQRGFQRGRGPLQTVDVQDRLVDQRQEQAEFLREILVSFKLTGFGHGEVLDVLTFDSVNVKPVGVLSGDANGEIAGAFTIPANIPAGTKTVRAEGLGGSTAQAMFTGQGTIEIDVMRRTTTIRRWIPQPPRPAGGGGSESGSDPQAQNFMLPEARQLLGIDFHLCALGNLSNNILVHQVTVENGIPTVDVMAEAFVPMAGATEGWKSARYPLPVTTPDDRDHSAVIKTDDNAHSVSVAALGGFDIDLQRKVTAHPYPIGPRLDGVNGRSWTAHQGEALSFRLVAARYPVTTKTVNLGSFNLVDCSDLQVRAAVELPSAACSVVFEIERTNGTIWRLLPFQVMQLNEFITETVQLRAVLKGTEKLSPILYAPVELIAGEIATTAVYITEAFKFGTAIDLTAYFKAYLPGGATVTIEYDKADGNWLALPLIDTEPLDFPQWVERTNEVTNITAIQGRLRITATGGPSARLIVGDLGASIR
ncbi:DUF4815 domain-containing protein [Mesorhizobium sp. ANAO-SY3R2]|uniref:DUF4815 domain-containing protein n=1 Tax=Mesorhizobium sp. ANAO-SY3R2 TaxID=3166644 RepID=UPI00366E16B4